MPSIRNTAVGSWLATNTDDADYTQVSVSESFSAHPPALFLSISLWF